MEIPLRYRHRVLVEEGVASPWLRTNLVMRSQTLLGIKRRIAKEEGHDFSNFIDPRNLPQRACRMQH